MEDLGGVAGVSLPREGPCPRSRHFGGVAEGKYRVSEGYVSVDDDVACLGPIMLDATEACGDAISFKFSSFTLMDSDSDAARSSSSVEDLRDGQRSEKGIPHMPEGSVFNPFDADECDASQAHLLKKILDELNDCVARCINFVLPVMDIDEEGTQATDEDILDSVNRDLLEVIVAQQASEILAGISRSRMDLCSCLTPTRFPLLNGIADSCPCTPVKCPPKSRVIKWSLRRKLDF